MEDKRPIGALVVGGDHPGLGIARSLGRRGIPVYILEDQQSISRFSHYAKRVIRTTDLRDERKTIDAVLDAGRRFNLKDWVLYPTRDENVAAFSRFRSELKEVFRVTTPCFETVQWAWDKNKTHELCGRLDIPAPRTWNPRSLDELSTLYSHLPLAIKPAVKENFFYATGAKAWRANTVEELQNFFNKAARQIRPEEIMVQEIIPGDGQQQYSYCAFVKDGEPHSTLVARRERQHPREFGRAATYVETVDCPEIEELSERFLKAINYYGLVEIEYKKDIRDGKYKLLDVNARTWGFHRIGSEAGVDFPYLLFADQIGVEVEPCRAQIGVGWLRLITDVPTAFSDIVRGHLKLKCYFRTLKNTRVESVYCKQDPLPSIGEFLLLPYLIGKRYV
jgi:D-aspartate ligase